MIFLAFDNVVHGDLACRNILMFRLDQNDSSKNVLNRMNPTMNPIY